MIKDFEIFTKVILVQMRCPYCGNLITHIVRNVPAPNLRGGDTMETTANCSEDDWTCPHCSHMYEVNLKNTICGGLIWIMDTCTSRFIEHFDMIEGGDDRRMDNTCSTIIRSPHIRDSRIKIENIALNLVADQLKCKIEHHCRLHMKDGSAFQFDGLSEDKKVAFECKLIDSRDSAQRISVTYYQMKNKTQAFASICNRDIKFYVVLVVGDPYLPLVQNFCRSIVNNIEDKECFIIISMNEIKG